ncbi:ATP-binding protein [Bosea sp. (in: a-proteobacteria)]|uniref:ATP-binding protein n=1 Tax=Bosea sp. (in: a-proteobacteria) TaxID=1871050 RepID=UPI002B49DC9A|nr:ATP-binding protein [Bosea sp. (in: a-proteobacteria)]WRH58010.1 MAG: histidine kinase dimerization/phospho-acceptor domain-containing protein [Bosea sp. (in: a-proteobacteria)]
MSEAGQDWARLGTTAAQDATLASYAAGGALLLWDRDAGQPGFTNAAARALLAGTGSLPATTRQRLSLLAGGLASPDRLRLERLRLTAGFAAALVTCGCKLVTAADGTPILAIAVPAAEFRRLGIALPQAEADPLPPPEAPAPATTPAEEPAAMATTPARAVRFLWQSDAQARLTSLSPNLAELAGPDAVAQLVGRPWADLIGAVVLDRSGGLLERLSGTTTWSGHEVLWRTATPGEGARVELSGVPVLDAARQVSGFRGFGLARPGAREPFPIAAEVAVAEPAVVVVADESDAAGDAVTADLSDSETPEPAVVEALDAAVVAPAQAAAPADVATATDEALPPEPVAPITAAEEPAEPPVATAPQEPQPGDEAVSEEEPPAAPAAAPRAEVPSPAASAGNIVPLRNGHLTPVRPIIEPSKPNLSSAERSAFREIAKALGARIAGDDEPAAPRLPPAAPLRLKEAEAAAADGGSDAAPASPAPEPAATARRLPNSHADLLDKLPIAVLVNRDDTALYANRTMLDLLDYADLDDLASGGGVSRLIKDAERTDGGGMTLIDRLGHLVRVDAVLSSLSWQGEPATLMAFRHPKGGGEVRALTPEEAEEAELAAEFEAEDTESAARVEALRLDAGVRDARIAELVAMLDTATDGVVTVDERGRILSLNKTAEALFGYDQREVTGELFTLLFAAESHAPALDYLEGLRGGGVASVMNDGREVIGRVRQGGKIPLFMTMGQIAEGSERRFCAVLRDITAWKKTEGELVEARKAAEKASAQKSDVLAKISHEIRTPLNAIIGFAEVMAEERFGPIANERYKEYLRDIHQSGGYVISLVNDLLDLAKIEAGKLDLDFVSVNLNEIALSAVSLLQPEAQRGRVVLRSGLSPKLPPVVADQRSIRQIVINLLSNAVKFTDAGGQVIISTALGDQGEAILRVRDTGIGMDDKEIELALEPFRQVPTTRRAGGTGLGLPLTKALVEANRAAMSITSVKKEGTLVEITFPPQRVLAG